MTTWPFCWSSSCWTTPTAGKVDDLELTGPGDGGAPVVTAILWRGATALGPRLGGRLGTWWLAIGRRLQPLDDPYPVRIPFEDVTALERQRLTVRRPAADYGTWLGTGPTTS